LGGEVAAERKAKYPKAEHLLIYTRGQVKELLIQGRMSLTVGGNIEVLEAFWHPEVDQTETSFTPPLLVYADLIQTGSLSKAGLNAVTRMLAGDMKADGVLVNSICPGWTATDMGGAGGRPVEEGADGIVWAATLPDSGPTGGFFRDGVPLPW